MKSISGRRNLYIEEKIHISKERKAKILSTILENFKFRAVLTHISAHLLNVASLKLNICGK